MSHYVYQLEAESQQRASVEVVANLVMQVHTRGGLGNTQMHARVWNFRAARGRPPLTEGWTYILLQVLV